MLGKGIKMVRERQGYNQKDLAHLVGTDQSYLSQIESGNKTPSMEMLYKICDALETPSELVFWFGVTSNDVPKENKQLFEILKPSIDQMLLKLFYVKK